MVESKSYITSVIKGQKYKLKWIKKKKKTFQVSFSVFGMLKSASRVRQSIFALRSAVSQL